PTPCFFIIPTVRRFEPGCPAENLPHSSAAFPPSAPHRDKADSHPHTPPSAHLPAPPPRQLQHHPHQRHASSAQSTSSPAESYAPPATAETRATGHISVAPSARNQS